MTPLAAMWQAARRSPVLFIVVPVVLIVAATMLWLDRHDAAVVAAHEQAIDARTAPARETASESRAIDTAIIDQEERNYHDVIANSGGDTAPDPASLALGCQRLRRAGVALPPACGPEGGN